MMKKYRKKLNVKKFVVFIVFVFFIIVIVKNMDFADRSFNVLNHLSVSSENTGGYSVIKLDKNDRYSGVGQEEIFNKDGYFSTFTTDDLYKKTYVEYKQNGGASWSKNSYWNDCMENTGCGITAMSIILSGYGKNVTPEDLRSKYFPVLDYESLDAEFSKSYGIQSSGFFYDSVHLSKEFIKKHLLTNRPVLVCVWNNPCDNRWTTSSHYMVLLACDDDNLVYVSNPNGGRNDSKSSGWYDFDEVIPYVAKALFVESY